MLDAALAFRNRALAQEGIGLRLERRGARIGLRGTLPDPDAPTGRRVRRISLGLPATAEGLEAAALRLRALWDDLLLGRYDPGAWSREPAPTGPRRLASPAPPADPLEAFRSAFFADPRRRRRPAGSRTTWTAAYLPYLRRLLRDDGRGAPLTAARFLAVLESYPVGSRSRQQCAVALAAFARHQGLPLPGDWSERAAGYGLHAARFRPLPDDDRILTLVEAIPNPGWRLVYGLMATYGLRNHEVFFCDLSALAPGGDRVLRVLPTTKTGEHQVWPFRPEWVEAFDLPRLGREPAALPPVCTDLQRTTLQQVGRRVAEQFRRYGLPITPYDLRHAWAVRTIHIGLPDTVAARMMGHSVGIHTRTYHHWITRRDQQRAVDAALARERPGPATVEASPVPCA
ncbi:MAG: site-specific integrase [Cyanobacteriota bacterium]|nr:site-specific integrase [Cyanobacteriota bacterium]